MHGSSKLFIVQFEVRSWAISMVVMIVGMKVSLDKWEPKQYVLNTVRVFMEGYVKVK